MVTRFRDASLFVAGMLVGSLVGGGAVYAAAAGDTIGCAPGQVIQLDPAGTWACVDRPPMPSPTSSSTVTPSPGPAPEPPALLSNCFGDVKNSVGAVDQQQLAACGYPTLASTGVPPSVVLTPYTGSLTITAADTVIDGKSIPDCLDIRTTGVTIRNSRITCTSGWAGVYADDAPAAANLRIDRVEITCVTGKRHGIWGHSMTVTAVYIHDCENGLEVNANSVVRDSYLVAREGDSSAHGDGIQSQGGNDVVIDHNTFAGLNPITASIITNPTSNLRWSIVGNFFSAGAYTLYCAESGSGAWVVRDNRFYGPVGGYDFDPHRPAYGFTDGCGGVGTWLGNYRDDTLAVVNR